jgi:hypothetical protein
MTLYDFRTFVYLTEDAFRDSIAFEILKSNLHFLSYVLTTMSRGESRIGRVIGNSQSEAWIGSFIFRADPSLRLVPDYSPLGHRNSHYANGSRIRPRNGSRPRIGLTPCHYFECWTLLSHRLIHRQSICFCSLAAFFWVDQDGRSSSLDVTDAFFLLFWKKLGCIAEFFKNGLGKSAKFVLFKNKVLDLKSNKLICNRSS